MLYGGTRIISGDGIASSGSTFSFPLNYGNVMREMRNILAVGVPLIRLYLAAASTRLWLGDTHTSQG